jgi:hypothetical protein
MLSRSINLVGVNVKIYAAGVEIDNDEAGSWEGYPAVVNGKPASDPECYVTDVRPGWCSPITEIAVFEFTCIGFGYGPCRGPIDFEVGMIGVGEVFDPDLLELAKWAKTLLGRQTIRSGEATEREVNFVVAYQYSSGLDEHSGEWDTEWECLGLVDLNPTGRGAVANLTIIDEPTSLPSAG